MLFYYYKREWSKVQSPVMRKPVVASAVVLCAFLTSFAAEPDQERLWKIRNLSKAFYENPTTQVQAADEFKKALDLSPGSMREQVNYGLALLRAGKTKQGVEQLEKVQREHPALPHTWFNLGIVYKKDGDFENAQKQFEQMVKLAPNEPISRYNLGVLLKQAGRSEEAIAEFQRSIALNHNLAAPHFQLYNVYRVAGKREEAAAELKLFQALKKAQEGSATPEDMEWCDYAEVYDPIDSTPEALAAPVWDRVALASPADRILTLDADGDGVTDVIAWSAKNARLYRSGRFPVARAGVEGLQGLRSLIAGDFDNDGLTDLAAIGTQGATLWKNGRGVFRAFPLKDTAGDWSAAAWLDFDHDYDLDLLLFGEKPLLLRNQGTAGFADRTADFPFVPGKATAALPYRMVADTKSFDLAVSYSDRAAVIYHDLLGGKYEVVNAGEVAGGSELVSVADFNQDSQLDLVSREGVFVNRPKQGFERAAGSQVPDFAIEGNFLRMRKKPANWVGVNLQGVKNLKSAIGAEVEVKTGTLYQKKPYTGHPIWFDLGTRKEADTIRITWANGLIQNETKQAAGKMNLYKEAQRLSGSCPLIWTWDGKGFRFITDVLGVAPLGASAGDGKFFPVDHDEWIQIPGEALKEVDGRYEIRITEELSEVAYLDQIQLYALDHPSGTEVFTNEKWKGQPFPEFRLFGVDRRVYPVSARDGEGRDVLVKVLKSDKEHPDDFKRTDGGAAETHSLELDFGAVAKDNKAVMVLHGWVDWADGSTFLAASQESRDGMVPPYLQVKNAAGEWQTVIDDMGMPDGKPKTISVDLSGKFLTAERKVRIVTNLCVYWDEIFLSENSDWPDHEQSSIELRSAEARFHGFSANKVHPQRKQPEQFFYEDASPVSLWNPTPGRYTRYGAVHRLLDEVDDRFVVMGSGDEVRLLFQAPDKAPKAGWKRDFLLKVDGWAKDRDANTAFSQSIEPLPFHGMSSYPYPAGESAPDTPSYRRYRDEYNTRPALRLIRSLVDDRTQTDRTVVP